MTALVKVQQPGLIKSTLLRWLGVPIHLTDTAFWASYYGNSVAGQSVTIDSTLKLSTAWACIRLISQTIATLPINMYERGADDSKSIARDHPLYELLRYQPNADMTAVQFWEVYIANLLLGGMAYSEKHRNGSGRLIALELLLPQRMQRTRKSEGGFQYRYADADGSVREIPESMIWSQPGFSLDGETGLSAIHYGAKVFGTALAADEAAAKTFQNGMLPTVYFSMPTTLTQKQRDEFRENKKKITGAINAGESPLLEAGMKAETIGINPADAQLLESRGRSVEEICRWFGVPPWMVGHAGSGQTKWGTGMEQELIGFLTFTLRPLLSRIEQGIRKDLLLPAERSRYFAEFAVEGLLRADSAARAQFFSTMVQNGLMTRNEARAKENLPPVEGGDILTVQSNLLPLDKLGGTTAAAENVKNAILAWINEGKTGMQLAA